MAAMSFYEGLHAELSKGEKRESLLVRVFLAMVALYDRIRGRLRRS